MYCECNKIQAFWEKLFKWWEHCTTEKLDTNARTTILGIRKKKCHSQQTLFPETALPFTYLRTIAYGTIRKERYKIQKGFKHSSVNNMINETLQSLQKKAKANMLYHKAKQWEKWRSPESKGKISHRYSISYFKECWEESGIAKITNTHTLPVIIRAQGH